MQIELIDMKLLYAIILASVFIIWRWLRIAYPLADHDGSLKDFLVIPVAAPKVVISGI